MNKKDIKWLFLSMALTSVAMIGCTDDSEKEDVVPTPPVTEETPIPTIPVIPTPSDSITNYAVLEQDTIIIDGEAQEFTIHATTDVEYILRPQDRWIRTVDAGRAIVERSMTFKAEANPGFDRTGSILVVFNKTTGADTAVCTVIQKPGSALETAQVWSEWPAYDNPPHYNFLENFPGYATPTKNVPESNIFVKSDKEHYTIEDDCWVFFAGPTRRSTVTEDAVKPMLKEFNYQFGYLRDKMGWPPVQTEIDGYRNMIILHQSGLQGQGSDTTAQGGWQSGIAGYPCVLLSYVPVQAFNPKTYDGWQTGASIHEGIHAVFASMPGCKDASWFHEGANTWLQAQLNIEMALENGTTSLEELKNSGEFGWLCMGSIMAPFMPIECYSGWLTTDNSFGGPAAQGNIDGLCTRAIIGGVQYSSVFPTFMSVALGKYSVAQIWAEEFEGYVLDRIEDYIGDEQTKRLILEYRARLCLTDMAEWSGAVKAMYNSYWGTVVGPERQEYYGSQPDWTAYPYVKTTLDEDGWYRPDDYTLPGWTGANIVPFVVDAACDTVAFDFETLCTNGDMRYMLCWNTSDGTPYYSEAFKGGEQIVVDLTDKRPANDVIFAIACNVNYVYNEEIRKEKYEFRVRPVHGISKKAAISKKWWDWSKKL